MFQPTSQSVYEEFAEGKIAASIFREYLEEVFNRQEPGGEGYDWRAIYGDPCLTFLLNLLDKDEAELFFLGVAVNLFNLQPEICTLLIIKSPDWHRHHSQNPDVNLRFHLSEEYVSDLDKHTGEELRKLVGRVPYSDDDCEMMRFGNLYASDMHPIGAATFWSSIATLRDSNLLTSL